MADQQFTPEILTARTRLLETGSFSDFTIVSQGVEFKVHRACLAGSSPYFAGAIDSGLAESVNRRLELDNENPCAIFLVIWYIYTRTYPAMDHSLLEWDGMLEATFLRAAPGDMAEYKSHMFLPHLDVYRLADLMMLPKLKQMVFTELRNQLLEFPKDHDSVHTPSGTKPTPWSQSKDLQDAIQEAYKDNDSNIFELRKFLAWLMIYNSWKWGYGNEDFEELAIRFPVFGWDLYRERDESTVQNVKSCDQCHKQDLSELNLIILEPDNTFTVLVCKCRHRGYCMDGCMAEGSMAEKQTFDDAVLKYCNKCSIGNRKSHTLVYAIRTEDGLQLVVDGSSCKLIAKNHYHKMEPGTF